MPALPGRFPVLDNSEQLLRTRVWKSDCLALELIASLTNLKQSSCEVPISSPGRQGHGLQALQGGLRLVPGSMVKMLGQK